MASIAQGGPSSRGRTDWTVIFNPMAFLAGKSSAEGELYVLYNPSTVIPTPNGNPTKRSGASIARRYVNKPWRRVMDAAAWVNGDLILEKPTITQAAEIFGVPASKIVRELENIKLDDEAHANVTSNGATNIIDAYESATPAERLEAAKVIGVAEVWDNMIASVID
jgi:hypothetical protein